jgi:DNA uptake protein ComE-like DNA-binding protein
MLRHAPKLAENESVQARKQFAAIAVLTVCFTGAPNAAFARAQSAASRTAPKTKSIPPAEARIDINHASADELLKVPGMTPSWAGRIVRFRPYRTKQDLLDRGVLPSDVYDRIKDYVIAHRDKE